MAAKVSRIRDRLISTNALGTTDITKDLPSAKISASRGATTLVFLIYKEILLHISTLYSACCRNQHLPCAHDHLFHLGHAFLQTGSKVPYYFNLLLSKLQIPDELEHQVSGVEITETFAQTSHVVSAHR